MAIRMNITPADVKRSKIIQPGWYPFLITDIKEEPSADKKSVNVVLDLEGKEGDAEGVPVKHWFSEKAPGFAIPFVRATGGRVTEEEGIDPNYDFAAQRGKVVMGHVITSRGKDGTQPPRNSIDDWAPVGASEAAAPAAAGFDMDSL